MLQEKENLVSINLANLVLKPRKILLFGLTGSGKSALDNLLINKDNNFAEVFKVNDGYASETKTTQTGNFTTDSIDYQVIDSAAVDDTREGNSKEFLNKIIDSFASHGYLNQVLFVLEGRFGKEQIAAYELLEKMILDPIPGRFITIVRTHFSSFEDEDACQKDKEALIAEKKEIAKIIKSVNNFIHVDNPPKTRRTVEEEWKKYLQAARTKLLNHLAKHQGSYRVANLDNFKEKILPNLMISQGTKELEEQLQELTEKSTNENKNTTNDNLIDEEIINGDQLTGNKKPDDRKPPATNNWLFLLIVLLIAALLVIFGFFQLKKKKKKTQFN